MTLSPGTRRKLRLGLFILLLIVSLGAATAVNSDQPVLGQVLFGLLALLMLAAVYVG